MAGLASPALYTWPEPVLLSRDLALGVTTCPWPGSHRGYLQIPGTPVHGTERGQRERERGQSLEPGLDHWAAAAAGLGILHKGTQFTMKRKYVIMG